MASFGRSLTVICKEEGYKFANKMEIISLLIHDSSANLRDSVEVYPFKSSIIFIKRNVCHVMRDRKLVDNVVLEFCRDLISIEKDTMTNKSDSRVIIRVKNVTYETYIATLSRFPDTLLGSPAQRVNYFNPIQQEFIFDRDIAAFESILFCYQSSGILSKPCWTSMKVFEEECRFFGISEEQILQMKIKEGFATSRKRTKNSSTSKCDKIWEFLDNPKSSIYAEIYSIFSLMLAILSNILSFAVTHPNVKVPKRFQNFNDLLDNSILQVEFILQIIFAIEFIAMILFAPQKWKILTSFYTMLDFVAIFPYFAFLICTSYGISLHTICGVLSIARILRVARWTKHSDTLCTVMNIINMCRKDLFLLMQAILVICMLFAALGYYAELASEDTSFTSIPQSMWWAIQTMVCLGYGDIVPTTNIGKLVASCLAIFGAVALSVPLISIGGKYMHFYTNTFSLNMGRDMKITKSLKEAN